VTLRKRIGRWRGACTVRQESECCVRAAVVADTLRHRRDIEHGICKRLEQASARLSLPMPISFRAARSPGAETQRCGACAGAAAAGRWNIHAALRHAVAVRQLLKAGIEIYEYSNSYLHAKVGVVDGVWAPVGSSIWSLSVAAAREANLVVRNPPSQARLRTSLLRAIKSAASG